jgi:hypothetical protein
MSQLHRAKRRGERVAFASGECCRLGADILREESGQRVRHEAFRLGGVANGECCNQGI